MDHPHSYLINFPPEKILSLDLDSLPGGELLLEKYIILRLRRISDPPKDPSKRQLNLNVKPSDDEIHDLLGDVIPIRHIFAKILSAPKVTYNNPYYISGSKETIHFDIEPDIERPYVSSIIPPTVENYTVKLTNFVLDIDDYDTLFNFRPTTLFLRKCINIRYFNFSNIRNIKIQYGDYYNVDVVNNIIIGKNTERLVILGSDTTTANVCIMDGANLTEVYINVPCTLSIVGSNVLPKLSEFEVSNYSSTIDGFVAPNVTSVELTGVKIIGDLEIFNHESTHSTLRCEDIVANTIKARSENYNIFSIKGDKCFTLDMANKISLSSSFEIIHKSVVVPANIEISVISDTTTLEVDTSNINTLSIINLFGSDNDAPDCSIENVPNIELEGSYGEINVTNSKKLSMDRVNALSLGLLNVENVITSGNIDIRELELMNQDFIPNIAVYALTCKNCTFQEFPDKLRKHKWFSYMFLLSCTIYRIEGKFNADWERIRLIDLPNLEVFRPSNLCTTSADIFIDNVPRLTLVSPCIKIQNSKKYKQNVKDYILV